MFKFRTGLEVLEKLGSFFAFFPSSSFYSTPILCFLFLLSYNIPSSISTCVLNCFSRVQLSVSLWTAAHQAPLWDFPGKNIGVGCHFLLQGILPTQGSNPRLLCLLHLQAGSSCMLSTMLGTTINKIKAILRRLSTPQTPIPI